MTTDVGTPRLTGKQRAFVDFYVGEADFNATQAARLAGYSDSSDHVLEQQGHENLRKPEIAKAIEQALAAREITRDYVLSGLKRSVEAAQSDKQHGAAIAGLRELGRALGLFVDRTEIDLNAEIRRVSIEINVTEDELRAELGLQGK